MHCIAFDKENPCCFCMSTLYRSKGKPQRNKFMFSTKQIDNGQIVDHELYFCDPCCKKHNIRKLDPNKLYDIIHPGMKARIMIKNGIPGAEQFKDIAKLD